MGQMDRALLDSGYPTGRSSISLQRMLPKVLCSFFLLLLFLSLSPVPVLVDESAALAQELYSLQDRLAVVQRAEQLEMENQALRERLNEAQMQLAEREQRLTALRITQSEILQAMTVLKKHNREFQQSILQVTESLPADLAVKELGSLVRGLIDRNRAQEIAAEEREMSDDAEVLASLAHPIHKLMRLSRNVNPLEASFLLVRWYLRLEDVWAAAHAPLVVILIEKSFRFWTLTEDITLFPLYSLICTHFGQRLKKVGENSGFVARLVTSIAMLFFLVRSEFDASESTDVVLLQSLNHILLGADSGELESDRVGSITGSKSMLISPQQQASAKIIVKSKRAFWVELRKLVIRAYCLLLRNEGEQMETHIRSTLDFIRVRSQEKVSYVDSEKCSPGMEAMLRQFSDILLMFEKASCPLAIVLQVFGQLLSLFNGHCCNALMLRRSYASMHAAVIFKGDLSHLEGWLRKHMAPEACKWLLLKVLPISEMINVLFMTKSQLSRPEIRRELCSHLTTAQLCQLLSCYEPQPGEESVPLSLIESLMVTNKSHQADVKQVLVDVSILDPIDLSVLKPSWLSFLSIREIKDVVLPDYIFEQFIKFREKSTRPK